MNPIARDLAKKQSTQDILDCAYKWRSADIHLAACRLGMRKYTSGDAEEVLATRLLKLRQILDAYKPMYGDV